MKEDGVCLKNRRFCETEREEAVTWVVREPISSK
jgi:hypothetical protein